jgi:hypothetical protein
MFGHYSNNPRNRESQIRATGIKGRSNVRRVFDNSQCAHVWAQQSQHDGRSSNGNFYFEGATIYSYRSNWPLGVFTQLPDGRRAIVLNIESYSNTTSGHLSDVRRAIRGLDGFEVIETNCLVTKYFADAADLKDSELRADSRGRAFAQWLESEARDYREYAASLVKPNKRVWGTDPSKWDSEVTSDQTLSARLAALNTRHDALMQRAALCALDCPVTVMEAQSAYQAIRDAFGAFYDPSKVAKRTKAAKQRAARSALINARKWWDKVKVGQYIRYRDQRRFQDALFTLITTRPESDWAELLREVQAKQFATECNATAKAANPDMEYVVGQRQYGHKPQITAAQWLNGARGAFYQESPTLVRRVGDTLETSRGANCPFKHAVVAFLKAQECRAASKAWHRNGQQIRVGVFGVDSIDEQGNMRAGCHTLKFESMIALAIQEVPHLVKPSFGLPALLVS